MYKSLSIAVLTLALIGLMACSQEPETEALADVNGKSITQAEFDAYLKFKRLPATDEGRLKKLLDQYLEREALAAVIEKEGLLEAERVKVELNEFRKEMLISRYFESFLAEKVTEEEIQNYYNTHASDYESRSVHVAHILIRTNAKMGELERKAKLTTAQEVYSKLRAGEPMEKLAEAYSEDKLTAKKGGDLGWIKEGGIDARFSKQAFNLPAGEISKPFETAFGFHVLKVIEGPKIIKQPLSAVKGNIRYQLRDKAKRAEMKRLMGLVKIEKQK
jgi:peptidyl-prolyl cis-trans isomerase C